MKSVEVEVQQNQVRKYSTDTSGYARIRQEQDVFEFLFDSLHIPKVAKSKSADVQASIIMQTVDGQSLRQVLSMGQEYSIKPIPWVEAYSYLSRYIAAEMDLLNRGALYRDMNFDHVIFNGTKAVLLDLESTIIGKDRWRFTDMRGTWETMAPEEFPGYGLLSTRTATYRTAVVAYVMLVGTLPFTRFPHSRAHTYRWRRKHVTQLDSTINKDLQRVFKIALSKKPEHRYKDPDSFLGKLVSVMQQGAKI